MFDTPYLALLHAFRRMRILNGLDKFSIFEEYKEWIIDDYNCKSVIFIKEEPIIQLLNMTSSKIFNLKETLNKEYYFIEKLIETFKNILEIKSK